MKRLIAILFSLLLTFMTQGAWAVSFPLDSIRQTLPSFIIITDEGEPLPVITDDDIIKKGVVVHFKVNSTRVSPDDPGYKQLRKALENIPPRYKFCRLLVLRGSASPEGPYENNKRLAHRRARALADSLSHYVTLPDSAIEERFINEDYTGLYSLISSSNFKYKEQVLSEIGNSDDEKIIKERLQAIDNGNAWKLLLRDYFPKLRATRVIIIAEPNPASPSQASPNQASSNPSKGGELEDTVQALISEPERRDSVTPSPLRTEGLGEVFTPFFAIKSNLLYDAAMTPNIEIERWFGKNNQWSIMAEWNFPWWQWHNKERVYEVNEFGVELRRWLFRGSCPKRQTLTRDSESGKWQRDKSKHWWLTGHFIAFYLAGGYYDLEWRYHGEQGDIYSAGFTYGYAIRLARHWNMEFSASVGFIHSPYTHYEAEHHDDILFAKYKKSFNYFGPTKLKVSIVWLLGRTKHVK